MVFLFLVVLLSVCPAHGYFKNSLIRVRSGALLMKKLEPSSLRDRQVNEVGNKIMISVITAMGVGTIGIRPANADFRAAQKRTYFRFIPKLIEGRDFYKGELKSAVDSEDWKVVSKFFDVYVSKYNGNDPSQIDQTDTYVNSKIFRPMKVFSSSFAERGSSEKQRKLIEQEMIFEVAMKSLENCVKDVKGEGFFAADIKMPTGAAKKKQGQEAWKAGKEAFNNYIEITNRGLMRELNTIEGF